jgi:hypothetical protein
VNLTEVPSTGTLVITPATVIAASKLTTPAIRRCAATVPCVETSVLTPVNKGASALPKFVSFNSSSNTLTIAPVDYHDIGVWTLTVTQAVQAGTNPVWDQVEITVGCTITRIDNPAVPLVAETTYFVYQSTKIIDLSSTIYLQVPNCNYPVTKTYAWTGITTRSPPLFLVSTNPQAISIQTNKNTEIGTFTVRLTATIADTGITSMTVVNGQVVTQNFVKAADTTETLYQIFSLCGPRTYVIVDSNDVAVPWIAITPHASTANTFIITLTPTLDAQEGSWSYRLKVTLDNYPTKPAKYENLSVTVSQAPCNCQLLTWDNPARLDVVGAVSGGPYTATIPKATANAVSKTLTPAIRSCYRGSPPPNCDET